MNDESNKQLETEACPGFILRVPSKCGIWDEFIE